MKKAIWMHHGGNIIRLKTHQNTFERKTLPINNKADKVGDIQQSSVQIYKRNLHEIKVLFAANLTIYTTGGDIGLIIYHNIW